MFDKRIDKFLVGVHGFKFFGKSNFLRGSAVHQLFHLFDAHLPKKKRRKENVSE